MYGKTETEASLKHLQRIVTDLNVPFCLIGGWAVYYTVNENYRVNHGRDYIGSRDIDIGLLDYDSFRKMESLLVNKLNFEKFSFRYVKFLNYDTGEEIPTDMAKELPLHMLIQLYVDAMIPRYSDDVRAELGFIPPDEPLLETVFGDPNCRRKMNIGNNMVTVPSPEMLVAMKMNSLVNRTKDHKKIKDVCDIASLCIYSGNGSSQLITKAIGLCDPDKRQKLTQAVSKGEIIQVANILDIPKEIIVRIMKELG